MASKKTEARVGDPWLWEHRVGVTPFVISAVVLTYALILAGIPQFSVLLTLLLTGAVAGAFWALGRRRWGRSDRVSDRQLYRYVEAVLITGVAGVMTIKIWGELSWNWIMWCGVGWVVATLALGSFWWNDNNNLTRIKLAQDVQRWPDIAKNYGLDGLKRSQIFDTPTGHRIRFWSPEKGHITFGQLKGRQDKLEGLFEIPPGMAKFSPVINRDTGEVDPNQWDFEWHTSAPGRKESIDFTEPSVGSVTEQIIIGFFEDGEPVLMPFYDQSYGGHHMLAGGTTGSGKSGLYHLLLAETARAVDVVRWGMDFKGGMSFRPWAPLFDWFITDEEEAGGMLAALRAVLEARAKYAAKRGWDPWQVSKKHPLLVLCVDECAIPFNQQNWGVVELGKVIAQQGRGAGVVMCLATQHATNEAVGSQQIMKNLTRRFAFRCADTVQQSVILPNGYGKVDCTEIPAGPQHAGKCYFSDGGVINKLMLRVRYVSKQQIFELVSQYWQQRCDLDRGSSRMASKASRDKDGVSAYDSRHIWTIDDITDPTVNVWEGDLDGYDDDAIWDEILGEKTAEEFLADTSDLPADGDYRPDLTKGTGEPHDNEEEIPVWDDDKGRVEFTPEFFRPKDAAAQAEQDQAVAEWNVERHGTVTTAAAEERLDKALRAAGRHGGTFGDLVKASGRKRTWTNETLNAWLISGRVHQPETGVWAFTDIELNRAYASADAG
jgi:hypothetical protein